MTPNRPRAFHPFLVGLFPIVFLYSRNVQAVDPREAIGPALIVEAATLAIFLGLRRLWGDAARAGVVASAGLILFFTFGKAHRLLGRHGLGGGPDSREALVLVAEVAAIVALAALLRRRPGIARATTAACNAGSVALVGISLAVVAGRMAADLRELPRALASAPTPATAPGPSRRPDIYFIVLDAYGRSDVLEEIYGFDNKPFLDRLERKGFFVARRSTSNYCQTALSISATLDGRYHDDLAGSRSPSRLPLRDRIADNATFRALAGHGYRSVGFATSFGITDPSRSDIYLAPPWNLGDFQSLVVESTPAWFLLGRRAASEPRRAHRDRILNLFDRLPEVARIDGPTFCLAHVVAPHPPFIFGPGGRDLSADEADFSLADGRSWCSRHDHEGAEGYVRHYRDQVAYVTGRIEEAIDRVLAASPEPPIIVLQGDHGPASRYDLDDDRPHDLRERMGILNAIYLPGGKPEALHDAITPVNTFRVVLDHAFGSRLGPLEDRNYHSSYLKPYVFTDVTAELREADATAFATR